MTRHPGENLPADDNGPVHAPSPTSTRPGSKLLVTPEEAAAILSVGRTTIYQLMATGQLCSVRIGSSRRIPTVALERFVRDLLDEAEAG